MASAYEIYKEGGLLNKRYQKLEDISEGAYGIVSLAKDIQRSKLVAVKYIFKLDDDKPSILKNEHRFSKSIKQMNDDICEEALHEIEIHERLGHHLNIISFLDCFDSFIILEYCPRGDLYEAIKDGIGPTSTRDIINVVIQLISAIEFAHSKSIYHRDIKPENILIADDWSIRLSDWGCASYNRYCSDLGVGSEKYMAPELFDKKNVHVYDASKVDIWSIGICLLNLVFHKSPFSVANETDKSFSYFACNREALFDIFSAMSMDLFAVLRYCLTLDPDNRDLHLMKQELLKVQSLTIDDDLELIEKEARESTPAEVKPITIKNKSHGAAEVSKSFAISTPNARINDHYQDSKREMFIRKDHFTPPALSAHYMENFENSRKGLYLPPHQRPTTPKNAMSTSNNTHAHNFYGLSHWIPANSTKKARRRGGSFNSFSANTGKYVPPNLRSHVFKSPLHTSVSNNEAVVFEDDDHDHEHDHNNDDDDDGLFVLEEADSSGVSISFKKPDNSKDRDSSTPLVTDSDDIDGLQHGISSMILEEDCLSDSSSGPSLAGQPSTLSQGDKGLSRINENQPSNEQRIRETRPSSSSESDNNSANNTKRGVYIPPHHRSNFQSSLKKPWRHQAPSSTQNHYHFQARRHSTSTAHRREIVSSSAPHHKSEWPNHPTKLDFDDYEESEIYSNFASRVGKFNKKDSQIPKSAHINGSHSKNGYKGGKFNGLKESAREVTQVNPVGS